MQVFKAFLKIAKKRLPSISLYFIVFVVVCLMMTATGEQTITSNFESTSLDICIIDHDNSAASAALSEYLDSIHHLVDLPDDAEVLQDNLYYRYIDYVLTIPAGFETNLLTGNTDNLLKNVKVPGSTNGIFIDQQVDAYLQTLQLYLAGGYSLNDVIATTDHSVSVTPAATTISFETSQKTGTKNSIFFFFRYLVYVLLCLIVSGLSPLLVTMNKRDIKERTLCSSLTLNNRSHQITLGATFYSLLTWLLFMLLGIICSGKNFFQINVLYCVLNSFAFLLFTVGFTLFLSSFSPDGNVISIIANVTGLGMSFLCGVFVPQSMLADNIVRASRFLPAYWYTRANDMMDGFSDAAIDMNTYWLCIGIQCLFALAFFVAALVTNQAQRQRSN